METVARRAAVGKASVYLRWSTKEALLTDAVTLRLARAADVDTGTVRGDLVELATHMLDVYAERDGRAAMRLGLEAAAIPKVAEHYDETWRAYQRMAARAIVRRGIDRGELAVPRHHPAGHHAGRRGDDARHGHPGRPARRTGGQDRRLRRPARQLPDARRDITRPGGLTHPSQRRAVPRSARSHGFEPGRTGSA